MTTLKLTRSDKTRKTLMVVFTVDGRPGSVRFAKSLFVDQQPPATLSITDDTFAGPRKQETKEERKARLAAMPKLTPAEQLAKLEAKIAKMKAKLATTTTPTAAAAPTPPITAAPKSEAAPKARNRK